MRRLQDIMRICAALLASTCVTAFAQTDEPPSPLLPARNTVDLIATHSNLSAALPSGRALNLRASWLLGGGDVLQAELLDEHKFGAHGGIAAATYTRPLGPDWYAIGTLAAGHGGPNWADLRFDAQISRKWLADRQLVTSLALYHARFEGHRSDGGARLSAAWYLELPAVLEVGTTLNVSQPGSVHSHMPWASATFGREGVQYLSVRVSSGTEAYQALGEDRQLVDFRSRSAAVEWRRWIGPRWGFGLRFEHYRNPTYRRESGSAGLFVQW